MVEDQDVTETVLDLDTPGQRNSYVELSEAGKPSFVPTNLGKTLGSVLKIVFL